MGTSVSHLPDSSISTYSIKAVPRLKPNNPPRKDSINFALPLEIRQNNPLRKGSINFALPLEIRQNNPLRKGSTNFFSLPLEIRQNILLRTYNLQKSRLGKAGIATSLHPGEPHSPHCDVWAKVGGHKVKAKLARHAKRDLADVKAKVDKLAGVHGLLKLDMVFVERKWGQQLHELEEGMKHKLVGATARCVDWNMEWHALREGI
ncbi:hypothetical protein E6O75_ATG04594 [Venturia nashicola]|uniref:Uncharacterized protein n=1 Tax=Venturia nashicola TaxID=86259 RepID=A0A4Z1PDK7_9PEZI|nr:hypothetical protein E6O75_ATG04594 [Venturia nashicola]